MTRGRRRDAFHLVLVGVVIHDSQKDAKQKKQIYWPHSPSAPLIVDFSTCDQKSVSDSKNKNSTDWLPTPQWCWSDVAGERKTKSHKIYERIVKTLMVFYFPPCKHDKIHFNVKLWDFVYFLWPFDLSFFNGNERTAEVRGQGSGVDVSGQLEVLEGVEGDVAAVHHGEDHRHVAALGGQQLDGSQVRNGAAETGRGAQVKVKVKVGVEIQPSQRDATSKVDFTKEYTLAR